MHPDRLEGITVTVAEVTPRTHWTFVEVESGSGVRGVGEATLSGRESAVLAAVQALAPIALAAPDAGPDLLPDERPIDLPGAAARSALDQALWDVRARRASQSLAMALGGLNRRRVSVYANINRRTRDRSPSGFAESARLAVAAGHRAVKLAPFDEVTGRDDEDCLAPALARVAAVREAVGTTATLMVDCHWRLTPALANRVIPAVAELGVTWLECPLPETPEMLGAIARLRAAANHHDMLLAGLETAIGIDGFAPFVAAGAYDVMMPDVKYVGSLDEVLRLAEMLRRAGVGFSPHNPSGPVCHAASLHVCAAVETVHSLEVQFDETPAFSELVGDDLTLVADGAIAVPVTSGLGVSLLGPALEGYRIDRWTASRATAS